MANIKILSVKITTENGWQEIAVTTVNKQIKIEAEVVDCNWSRISESFESWQAIKSTISGWSNLKSY